MHTTKSLKDKKKKSSYGIFIQQKNNLCFSMYFGFNNQFIKAIRTRPIFQKKYLKNIFFSFSIWIMNLYIKHISDIKKEVSFY
jgi:hypothetical protein